MHCRHTHGPLVHARLAPLLSCTNRVHTQQGCCTSTHRALSKPLLWKQATTAGSIEHAHKIHNGCTARLGPSTCSCIYTQHQPHAQACASNKPTKTRPGASSSAPLPQHLLLQQPCHSAIPAADCPPSYPTAPWHIRVQGFRVDGQTLKSRHTPQSCVLALRPTACCCYWCCCYAVALHVKALPLPHRCKVGVRHGLLAGQPLLKGVGGGGRGRGMMMQQLNVCEICMTS